MDITLRTSDTYPIFPPIPFSARVPFPLLYLQFEQLRFRTARRSSVLAVPLVEYPAALVERIDELVTLCLVVVVLCEAVCKGSDNRPFLDSPACQTDWDALLPWMAH